MDANEKATAEKVNQKKKKKKEDSDTDEYCVKGEKLHTPVERKRKIPVASNLNDSSDDEIQPSQSKGAQRKLNFEGRKKKNFNPEINSQYILDDSDATE